MKVAVTGGTGFIGNYVVNELLRNGAKVIVTGTGRDKAAVHDWFDKVEFLQLDLNNGQPGEALQKIAACDKLIHLAWSGLPNYKGLFHFEENLFPQYLFLKKLVTLGLKDITVTGTCFEYGMREGALEVAMPADPQNPYALAKDTLRKFLQQLQQTTSFRLKWLRLFYMYGKGQSEKSILSQLDKALIDGDEIFNMSGGEQLRDYLPVERVAAEIAATALADDKNGIYNVCSGVPISIKTLVQEHLAEKERSIKLNFGYYPYPDYEPMAFWGVK
jgi:nucleoside-diphosphate-sugar epimerase